MIETAHILKQERRFDVSRRTLLTAIGGGAVALSALPALASEAAVSVVTTTSQVGDAVRVIGGDHVLVKALMGEGVDPHTFRQTRTDIVELNNADIVFANGLRLEAQLVELLEALSAQKPVVAVAEKAPADRLLADSEYEGQFDPHVWMDVALWAIALEGVRDGLIEVDGDRSGEYEVAFEAYRSDLAKLDEYVRTVLSSVPQEKRVLVSAHDAFGYFGNAYDFDVVGIQGLSTESEAGLERVEALVDLIVERKLPAVFVETSVADRNVRALIEGAASRGHAVQIGGSLFSDAMGAPGTYEGTYVGMIDHNATVIASALGGDVSAGGWQGKLGTNG